VVDLPLDDALDAWLKPGPPRLIPVFPQPLESLYVAETAESKMRALRISTAIGIVSGIVVTIPFWFLLTDAHAAIRVYWLGLGIPLGCICHLILWSRLPIAWQERQTAVFGVLVALCFSALMTSTAVPFGSCYIGGILLLTMLDVIAGGFSFLLGAAYAATLAVLLAVVVQHLPGTNGTVGLIEAGLMGVCSLFAVFGAWRVETETRRSYALMLRERLKRRDLSHLNSELVELARRDPLTGLANRRAYEIAEAASWRSAERAGIAVGLVIIDIDHFKSFNDFYGHPAGDACLQAVARCLAEQVRGTGDVVARVGGEEFAILLPDLTVDTAGDIAERVRQAVAALELPHLGCGPGRTVTVSCGACSLVPEPGTTPKDLFAAADAALYAAKQAGRNRVCLAEQLVDIPRYGGAAQAASLNQR
jgi:diguanylate cyclase (GGDEF)-like protein